MSLTRAIKHAAFCIVATLSQSRDTTDRELRDMNRSRINIRPTHGIRDRDKNQFKGSGRPEINNRQARARKRKSGRKTSGERVGELSRRGGGQVGKRTRVRDFLQRPRGIRSLARTSSATHGSISDGVSPTERQMPRTSRERLLHGVAYSENCCAIFYTHYYCTYIARSEISRSSER